jgi:hypothetical protein
MDALVKDKRGQAEGSSAEKVQKQEAQDADVVQIGDGDGDGDDGGEDTTIDTLDGSSRNDYQMRAEKAAIKVRPASAVAYCQW